MPTSSIHSALEFEGKGLHADLEAAAVAPVVPSERETAVPDFLNLRQSQPTETLEEIIQHLEALGYLPTGPRRLRSAEGKGAFSLIASDSSDEVAEAWDAFRTDALLLGQQFVRPAPPDPLPADFARPVDPLWVRAEEIRLLRSLASVDGSVRFKSLPATGETGLRTRVLRHLLALYDVLPADFPPASPFGNESERALRGLFRLKAIGGDAGTDLSRLNTLADLTRMAVRFAEFHKGTAIILPAPSGDDWRDSLRQQRATVTRFRTRAAEIRNGQAEGWRASDESVFTIRILQLYLWHRGHYLGELDSMWGAMTHTAFLRAAQVHAAWDLEDPSAEFLSSGNGRLRIKLTEFVRQCEGITGTSMMRSHSPRPADEPAEDLFVLQDAISAQLADLAQPQTGRAEFEEQEAKVWSRMFAAVDATTARQRANPAALRNFQMGMIGRGVERILRKIGEFAKEIVGRVVTFASRVKAFISKLKDELTGAVLQAFRFLARALSAVTRVARLAARRVLRMITGTPYFSGFGKDRWIVTRFSFDQDAVNCYGPGLLPSDIDAHYAIIREENRSLDLVMTLGATVLGIVVSFVPPLTGWRAAKLAFAVFRSAWQIIAKEKNRPAHELPAGWKEALMVV